MLKVIRLNLTFFTRCLKKSAWHKRCSVRSRRAFLTITIFVPLMKFAGPFLTLAHMRLGGLQHVQVCGRHAAWLVSASVCNEKGSWAASQKYFKVLFFSPCAKPTR